MNHDALTALDMALRSAERNLAAARTAFNRLNRTCRQCREPLDGAADLCEFCAKMLAAHDAEVVA